MEEQPHRRDFVRTLALGATTGFAHSPTSPAPALSIEQDEKPAPERTEVDARMDLILARYGKHLDEAARKSVRAEVESIVRRGESLRKFALDNGDGPCPIFVPYRGTL